MITKYVKTILIMMSCFFSTHVQGMYTIGTGQKGGTPKNVIHEVASNIYITPKAAEKNGNQNSNHDIESNRYNFYFSLQGDAHGKVLLVMNFRIYYEAVASVNLIAEKHGDKGYDFYFDKVNYAYVARTLDLTGKKMCIMNAGYDYASNMRFSQEKEKFYTTQLPYYSNFIKHCGLYPYLITAKDRNAVHFSRDIGGIHRDVKVDFKLQRQFNNKKFQTYFHIDPIMAEGLKIYNHSFLPRQRVEELLNNHKTEWYGTLLDYSKTMNEISRLISTFTEKHVIFKQEESFRIMYKVVSNGPDVIHIVGEIYPDIKIWSDWKLKKVVRNIKLRKSDLLLLEDSIIADMRSKKDNGGTLQMFLKKID